MLLLGKVLKWHKVIAQMFRKLIKKTNCIQSAKCYLPLYIRLLTYIPLSETLSLSNFHALYKAHKAERLAPLPYVTPTISVDNLSICSVCFFLPAFMDIWSEKGLELGKLVTRP